MTTVLSKLFRRKERDPGLALTRRRTANLLRYADKSSSIIEIGPSFAPIAPRRAGWTTWIVDHLSREQLIDKYQAHDGRMGDIETVDTIWSSGAIADAVPADRHATFDVLIASHVIEHLPNLLLFLISSSVLLRQSGIVSLAIPDKRFCFDYYKPVSTTGDIVGANIDTATKHSPRTVFNHYAYSVKKDGKVVWGQEDVGNVEFVHSIVEANNRSHQSIDADAPDLDCHVWQFTPASFRLIILELGYLGMIDWTIKSIYPVDGCEFIAHLERGNSASLTHDAFNARRLELLDLVLLDQMEQIEFARKGIAARLATSGKT